MDMCSSHWFLQVDAGLRSMLSDLRALVTAAKLEDCAPDMHPTATPINTTWNEHIGLKADLTPINEVNKTMINVNEMVKCILLRW